MKSLAKKIIFAFLFSFLLVGNFSTPVVAQSGLGGLGQVPFVSLPPPFNDLEFKDLDCDGREDLTTINILSLGGPGKLLWGLLCPAKVDKNCDGRSDLTGTAIFNEPHFARQCTVITNPKTVDLDCDGFDDKYPNIDVRRTDYWNQVCPDPTKYTDANCDGFDDKLGDDLLKGVDNRENWRLLCPAKVDRNCDARADISGLPYFPDLAQLGRNPTVQERNDYEAALRQCPGGFKQAADKDCNGADDEAVYYIPPAPPGTHPTCLDSADPNYQGPKTPTPVCMDITNTDYWKRACAVQQAVIFKDANCDGIEDVFKFNLVEKGFRSQWIKMCPAKVDRNCDGYSDLTGQEYGGLVDKNKNPIKLSDESHHKYQCPQGFSIQTSAGAIRDGNCDGYDDLSYAETRIEYVNGQYTEVAYREHIDLTNTEYWKRQCGDKKSIIGSRPFSRFGGAEISSDFIRKEAVSCTAVNLRFDSFEAIICSIRNIIARLFIPFAFVLGTLFFMYGVIKYFMAAPSSDARKEGRRYIIWAIIALFVMLAIWGIITLITSTLGFGTVLPQLNVK